MRFRYWPRFSRLGLAGSTVFGALAVWAAVEQSWLVATVLAVGSVLLAISMLHDCAAAGGIVMHALDDQDESAAADSSPSLEALEPFPSGDPGVDVNGARAGLNPANGALGQRGEEVPAQGLGELNGNASGASVGSPPEVTPPLQVSERDE
jgi:hypothetical protein